MPHSPLDARDSPNAKLDEAAKISYSSVLAKLTAEGQPLEVRTETVDGVAMNVFANRPRRIADLLAATAQYPDRVCLIDAETRLTYRAFLDQVKSYAGGLRTLLGGEPGARVGILSANRAEWVIAMWAILYAGASVVALNGWWQRAEIQKAVKDTNCQIVIGDARRLQRAGDLECSQIVSFDPVGLGEILLFSSLKEHAAMTEPAIVAEDDTAAVLFTSGTTGNPTGVIVSHRAWIAGLMNSLAAITAKIAIEPKLAHTNQDVRLLASLPFFHVGGGHGAALTGIASGATLVIPPEKFDPGTVLEIIEIEKITRWSAVPAMVQAVCLAAESGGHDLSSLKTLGYGAAPSGSQLLELAYSTFPKLAAISNAYGLTETCSVIAMNTGEDFRNRPASVGRAFATAEIRVTDDGDQVLPDNTPGNIQVRGPFLASGFLEENANDVFAPERWLRTGDIGYLDEEGFLYLVDRKKDVIIRGGENIFAGEVERRLELHPDILESAVVPSACERLGEKVRAVVRLRPGGTLDASQVQDWVGCDLAPFKVPAVVEYSVDPLPRNAAGKILKRQVRDTSYLTAPETSPQ